MLLLFRLLSRLPLPVLHTCGTLLGWLVWVTSPTYRRHFRANVAQAGLPFSAAKPAIAQAGRLVFELPQLWLRAHGQSCLTNVAVEGKEHVQDAIAQGKGLVFFGAHCGCFELASQILGELYGPVTAMYRPARQGWLAHLMGANRDRPGLTLVPTTLSGIRQLHHALRQKKAVALLADQVPPQGLGLWTPFFGKSAYTMTLAARLALQNGAMMLPVNCERLQGGRGYTFKIWPPLSLPMRSAKPDLEQLVMLMNQSLESIVRSHPGQYLWGYARYKTPRQNDVGGASN